MCYTDRSVVLRGPLNLKCYGLRTCLIRLYRVAKKVSHYLMIVNLKYESSTIILFFGIRYSMRDLLSDLNNYA